MSIEVDRDHSWLRQPCAGRSMNSESDDIVDAVKTEPKDTNTISDNPVNGRSPTPLTDEHPRSVSSATEPATLLPDVKENWSSEVESRRSSLESDGLSDAWSSVTSLPVLDYNKTAEIKPDVDGEPDQPEAEVDSRGVIVVTDSSSPPSSLATRPDADKEVVVSPTPVASVNVTSGSDESVVRKLESFVESMSVRRSVKSAAWTDPIASSFSTFGLDRPTSFSVGSACRPLNGVRDVSSSSILLPYCVPFKSADVADHPLDLSSTMHHQHHAATNPTAAATFVQTDDYASLQDADVNSLESLQNQFGENSAMLERIGVRRRTASGVIALAGAGSAARMHGTTSPLNGIGLYGPALNEPCVPPPPCRPFPSRIAADSDGATPAIGHCFDASRASTAERRAAARRLVRGQDAWMNGVSGRQRRSSVLRCLECNLSFWTLPELTLHMIKTAHYANIVRSSFVTGAPLQEMTSSPPAMMSFSSPVDSNSDSSDIDNISGDTLFRQVASVSGGSDFRLARLTKRERETSPADDDSAKRSKIWRPDCPPPSSQCPGPGEQPTFHATSSDGRLTPTYTYVQGHQRRRPRGVDHDRTVTSSKSPEDDRGAAVTLLYDWSPGGRSDEVSEDSRAARPPALTAMKDFITRSICELDRAKRRPLPSMPILPAAAPTLRPSAPQPTPNDLLPPAMAFADLMFPLFPLAQFFPEQLLAASRALNFLPLVQSMARMYGDRLPGLDFPLFGPQMDCSVQNPATDDIKISSRHRAQADVAGSFSDGKDFSKYHQVNGVRGTGSDDVVRPASNKDGLRRQKLSPTSSSCLTDHSLTALDSLRGFVYGDRKRPSEHARTERKCDADVLSGSGGPDDDEAGRRRARQSPSVSSVGDDSVVCAPSPVADCRPDGPNAATMCGTDQTNDYDSRFDKYYRLARELAGQLH